MSVFNYIFNEVLLKSPQTQYKGSLARLYLFLVHRYYLKLKPLRSAYIKRWK